MEFDMAQRNQNDFALPFRAWFEIFKRGCIDVSKVATSRFKTSILPV
jgi:hypothetical protein